MDDPAQNPQPNQTDPLRASLTNDNPPAPEPPAAPPIPPTEPPVAAPPPADVPTPPQESLPPTDQYQATPWAQQPAPNFEQAPTAYSQAPEDQTMPAAPPPIIPETPKSSSPKGFIIGGLLALIIVAAIFGAMTFLNKKGENLPTPPPSKTSPPKAATSAPTPLIPTSTLPALTPAPTPTPKTTETYTNSTYKYQFEYPLGLTAPAKITPDTTRFPKALETVKLNLSSDPAASLAAYFTVWAKVEDVPKYITDGQSQFVKVNQYTTNRFTVKKPSGVEETHYLTQKFDNTYDLMLESPSGRISDPVFEKILNSFTFLESATSPTAPPVKTSSPSSTLKPGV